MIVLGVSVLGNLNKQATSQKSLGTSFWRIVIASGILMLILGVANLFANYIFRNKELGISAREVRAHGAVAPQKSLSRATTQTSPRPRRSFHLGRSDTLPTYYAPQSPRDDMRQTRNISAPVNVDHAQFEKFKGSEEIRRPDSALHPALAGARF